MSAPALTAELLVDLRRAYHVGAGHGRGTSLDSALFTETIGGAEVPAVRYAHGVLRQAAYDLLQTPPLEHWRLCPASGGPRERAGTRAEYCTRDEIPCPLCRIFGSAAWPSPWAFSTMRPAKDAAPSARVVSRASVDPRTRRARDATLFSEELGAPGAFALTALREDGDAAEAREELAFLAAAARTVRGLGADRRRGRGEGGLALHQVNGAPPDDLLKVFEAAWLKRAPEEAGKPDRGPRPFAAEPASTPAVWTRPAGRPRTAVHLLLRLREPLAAGTRPLVGNVLESERFVPGTLLLGALAGRALRSGGAGEAEFLRAFRGGGVLFPDLLPAAEDDAGWIPTLPAPPDLFTCGFAPGPVAEGGHGYWSALLGGAPPMATLDPLDSVRCARCRAEVAALSGEEREDELRRRQVKAIRLKDFLVPDREPGASVRPEMRNETKVQVHPGTGRVQGGSLYHREVIPTGTLLTGTLLADAECLADLRRWGVLPEEGQSVELHLGKRSGRGYGRATLAVVPVPAEDRERARRETRHRVEALLAAGRPVPVVAASRLQLRDAFGRCLRSLAPADLGLDAEGACAVEWAPVGGFWRHLGLPRRQQDTLLAGSVLHVRPKETTDRARLADALVELEHGEPRGERTAEGFGRLAIDPFPYAWTRGEEPPAATRIELPPEVALEAPIALAASASPPDPFAAWRSNPSREPGKLFGRDEWRAVARLLYAHAGEEGEALADWLEGKRPVPDGKVTPAKALDDVGQGRAAKLFLVDGAGKDGWTHLRPLLEALPAGAPRERERAAATRALADAIAAEITPGKGTDA